MCPNFNGCEDTAVWMLRIKSLKKYEGKTNDFLIAFIGYVNDLNKLQQFKLSVQKSHHRLRCTFPTLLAIVRVALLRSSWRSCFMMAALFINASNQFFSCVYFFFVDFAFHPSPQTKIGSVRANFKQLYLHTHWKLDTCLYELNYSE